MPVAVHYSILAILGLGLMFFNPLVDLAVAYNKDLAVSGTAVFASLRVISSIMSIVRDADIQGSIGLASISTSPGQALHPVVDTVDRLANLLFALSVASGVIGFTLPIISSIGGMLLTIGAGARALVTGLGRPFLGLFDRIAHSCMSLGFVAAICIPAAYSLAFVLGDHYTAAAWNNASKILESHAEVNTADDRGLSPATAATKPPSAPPRTEESTDVGFFDWILNSIAKGVNQSGDAIEDVVDTTAGFASTIADGAKVVNHSLEAASDLFLASIDIGVAYLVKLIFLPIFIFAGTLWLVRTIGPVKHD